MRRASFSARRAFGRKQGKGGVCAVGFVSVCSKEPGLALEPWLGCGVSVAAEV